jgi:hypothetical protein
MEVEGKRLGSKDGETLGVALREGNRLGSEEGFDDGKVEGIILRDGESDGESDGSSVMIISILSTVDPGGRFSSRSAATVASKASLSSAVVTIAVISVESPVESLRRSSVQVLTNFKSSMIALLATVEGRDCLILTITSSGSTQFPDIAKENTVETATSMVGSMDALGAPVGTADGLCETLGIVEGDTLGNVEGIADGFEDTLGALEGSTEGTVDTLGAFEGVSLCSVCS